MSSVPVPDPAAAAGQPTLADRLAPARRPPGPPIGYQEWRRLLFLHWPMWPELVRSLVPERLALDLYDGAAYVGLIPFVVQALRPIGAPRWLGLDFLETNVRTYVHLGGREPGVYFFSLDAASLLAVIGVRAAFGLPYFFARGQERLASGRVEYTLRRISAARPSCHVEYEVGEPLGPAEPGTLEHFLLERYLLHVQRGPTLWTVQVHHRPYPLQWVRRLDVQDELVGAAGLPAPSGPPLAHYASGVDGAVFAPRVRLTRGNAR